MSFSLTPFTPKYIEPETIIIKNQIGAKIRFVQGLFNEFIFFCLSVFTMRHNVRRLRAVAAFGAEYSRLDRTKLWKKLFHFTRMAAIAGNRCYAMEQLLLGKSSIIFFGSRVLSVTGNEVMEKSRTNLHRKAAILPSPCWQ